MNKGQTGRDTAVGAESSKGITEVAAAYTVLPTDRVIFLTGTSVYTLTLCAPSEFPAGEILTIIKETTGAVTVSTPSGGLFATASKHFTVDDLAAADDHKVLLNTGFDWIELKEITT